MISQKKNTVKVIKALCLWFQVVKVMARKRSSLNTGDVLGQVLPWFPPNVPEKHQYVLIKSMADIRERAWK